MADNDTVVRLIEEERSRLRDLWELRYDCPPECPENTSERDYGEYCTEHNIWARCEAAEALLADQGGALGEVERAPELGRLYDRLMQVTEHRDVRKYGEEHTPFSNGAKRMAVAVRAEFEALFSDFRAQAEGTTETPDAPRCPGCGHTCCPYQNLECGGDSDVVHACCDDCDDQMAPPAAPDTGGGERDE